MPKITFKKEPTPVEFGTQYDISTVTFEFDDNGIPELIAEFRYFLLALGYHPETIDKYLDKE